MNKLHIRGSKKGVTPVIATIILIAGTLVLALVVGAYTFGLFGSNVKTVTLSSATLYGGTELLTGEGTSYISFSLNNPGSSTEITSMTITSSASGFTAVSQFYFNNGGVSTAVVFAQNGGAGNALGGGQVSTYTFYSYGAAQSIVTGQEYNYVINFANGQSVSGVLTAQ
jgi:flagellin-like protein